MDFDRRVRSEFRSVQLSSDGGLLVMRELDDVLELSDLASAAPCDNRRGKNTVHRLGGLFRQSVYGRPAGYEDVNDADRLALDPVMRQVVGGRAVNDQAASPSQMGRFETETLGMAENQLALTDLSGLWVDRLANDEIPRTVQRQLCLLIRNLISTNRIVGRVTASQIASASTASDLPRFT